MDSEDKGFSPPYNVPWSTFHNTVEKVAADLPNRIDRSYLASQSGTVQTYLISAFRGFGLTDEDDVVQDELRDLAKDAEGRPARVAALLERHYAAAVELGRTNATPGELDQTFAAMFPRVTGESRVKAIRFFLSAATYAGLQMSPLWKAPKAGPSGSRRARSARKSAQPNPQMPAQVPPAQGDAHTVNLRSGGAVTLSVSVNLFGLSRDDREFVLGLIDQLTNYENQKALPPGDASSEDASQV